MDIPLRSFVIENNICDKYNNMHVLPTVWIIIEKSLATAGVTWSAAKQNINLRQV